MERYVTTLEPGTKVKLTKSGIKLLTAANPQEQLREEYTLDSFESFFGWWLLREPFNHDALVLFPGEFEVIKEEN